VSRNGGGASGSRERILEAATVLFLERGYKGTSVKAIAEETGITTPALYWHFPSKQELFYVAMEQLLSRFMEDVRAQVTADEPVERLRQWTVAHVRWQLERREQAGAYALTFGFRGLVRSLPEPHRSHVVGIERAYLADLRALLQAGAEAGVFAFEDLRVTAFAIITLCEFAHSWFDPEGPLSAEQVADLYSGLVLKMVSAPAIAER
jgi:AcrR family transcriptional regulator